MGFLSLRGAGRGLRSGRVCGLLAAVAPVVGRSFPGTQAPAVLALGTVALWWVGSPQTGDRAQVPCIGRRILSHWTTREFQLVRVNLNSHLWLVAAITGQCGLYSRQLCIYTYTYSTVEQIFMELRLQAACCV